jgi:hypothetical protein
MTDKGLVSFIFGARWLPGTNRFKDINPHCRTHPDGRLAVTSQAKSPTRHQQARNPSPPPPPRFISPSPLTACQECLILRFPEAVLLFPDHYTLYVLYMISVYIYVNK